MQIDVGATPGATLMTTIHNDEGAYEVPRSLVLALDGYAEAVAGVLEHLRETGQVQPGDVVDTNWPAP
jgi:hypothetical protein